MAKSRNQVIFRRGKTAKIIAQDNDEGYQSYGEPIYDEDKGYLYTGIRKQVVDENEIERTVYPHAKELFPIKVRTVQGWYTDDTNSQSLESPSSATATNKVQSKDVRDYSITGDWHVSGGNNDVLRIKTTGRIEFNQNGDTLEDPVLRLDTRNSVNRALVDAKGYLESTNIRTTNIKGISGNDLITLTDDTTAISRKVDINKVGDTSIGNDDTTATRALTIYNNTTIGQNLANKYRNLTVNGNLGITGLTTHNGGLTVAKGQISNLLGNVNLGQAGDNSNYADNSYIFYGKILGAKYSKTSSTIIDNSTIKLGDAEGQIEAKYLKGTTSITGGSLSATTGSFTSTLIVTGATTLKSTLNVTGKTTLSSLEATSGSFSGILKTSSTDSKAFVVGEDKFYVSGSTGDITTDGTLNSLYLQSPNISSIYLSRTDQSSKTSNLSTTVLGAGALNTLTDGSYNTAIGYCSLNKNEQGQYNTGVGYNSIASNKTTNYNTALGHQALMYSVADFNTGVGANALRYASTGATDAAKGNTAVGCYALSGLTTGPTNVAIGYNALGIGTSIANNVAIGNGSGSTMTTGSQCVLIGANTAPGTSTGVNQIVIGYNAVGNYDNSVVIGNDDIKDTYLKGYLRVDESACVATSLAVGARVTIVDDDVKLSVINNNTVTNGKFKKAGFQLTENDGIGLGGSQYLKFSELWDRSCIDVSPSMAGNGSGSESQWLRLGYTQAFKSIHCDALYTSSDERLKDNIKPYESKTSILDLNVKEFTWIDSGKKSFGVIAQELKQLFPEMVEGDENKEGRYLSIQESKLSYLLLIELKKIRKELDEIKSNKKIKKILSKK